MPVPDVRDITRQISQARKESSEQGDQQQDEATHRKRRAFGLKGELRANTVLRTPNHTHDKSRPYNSTSANQESNVTISENADSSSSACSAPIVTTSVTSVKTVLSTISAGHQPISIPIPFVDSIVADSTQQDAGGVVVRDIISNSSNSVAGSAPACPQGNNTVYDYSGTSFTVHCNADNEEPSSATVSIASGGYSSCFSSCSDLSSCAGFTYVGLDFGSCYLKSDMPESLYVAKNGSNYVSCSKVTSIQSTSVNDEAPVQAEPSSSKAGVIVGGTIGGFVFVVLLLVLLLVLHKRHRLKDDQAESYRSRARSLNGLGGLALPPPDDEEKSPLPLHSSHGSTGNDIFSPFGGAYFLNSPIPRPVELDSYMQPARHHARQRSTFNAQELDSSEKR